MLKGKIRIVPDFPKEGINFFDITSITTDAGMLQDTVRILSQYAYGADYIVGVESRGFVFGAAVAFHLGKPFVFARKSGKLPAKELVSQEYNLEYGTAILQMNRSDILPGKRYFIVDDLVATGGTLDAVAKMLTHDGAIVDGFGAVIGIKELKPVYEKTLGTSLVHVVEEL